MQWLNHVDDALESVLLPRPPRPTNTSDQKQRGKQEDQEHEEEQDQEEENRGLGDSHLPGRKNPASPAVSLLNSPSSSSAEGYFDRSSTQHRAAPLPPPRRPGRPVVVPASVSRSLPGSVQKKRRRPLTTPASAPAPLRTTTTTTPGRLKRSPLPKDVKDGGEDVSEKISSIEKEGDQPRAGAGVDATAADPLPATLQRSIQRLPSHHSQLSRTTATTPLSAQHQRRQRLFAASPQPARVMDDHNNPNNDEAPSGGDAAAATPPDHRPLASPPDQQSPPSRRRDNEDHDNVVDDDDDDDDLDNIINNDDHDASASPDADEGDYEVSCSSHSSNLDEVDLNTPGDKNAGETDGAAREDVVASPRTRSHSPSRSLSPLRHQESDPPPPASDEIVQSKSAAETAMLLPRRSSTAVSTRSDRRDSSGGVGNDLPHTESFRSSRSLPRQVELRSEFDAGELRPRWTGVRDTPAFDNAQHNRYGIFHVRLLRAQRLPCSVGTAVQGVVALRPWDGKVRTLKARAFAEPSTRRGGGVCVRWGDDATPVSMVHARSDEETPVPAIRIELVFQLVFEFHVCSLEIPCDELMAAPRSPRRQWFAATTASAGGSGKGTGDGSAVPLLEVEAVFEPAGGEAGGEDSDDDAVEASSVDAREAIPMESIELGSLGSSLNEDVVTLPTPSVRASISSPRRDYAPPTEDSDLASLSQRSNIRGEGKATPHLLRVASHWTPAVCCVCKRSIVSGLSNTRSYHCEGCGVDCCADCRLQVDIRLPCGSELAERSRAGAIQNKLTMANIINTVAPVGPESNGSGPESAHGTDVGTSVHSRRASAAAAAALQEDSGIGTVRLEFVRALVFEHPVAVDTDPATLEPEVGVKKGDYYMRVTPLGGTGSKRTRTMQNTGRPKFDSDEMKFRVPHYGTEFRIELVDAATNNPVGSGFCTTQSLLQRQRDDFVEQKGLPLLAPFRGPPHLDFHGLTLDLRSGVKTASEFYAPSKIQSTASEDKPLTGDVVGIVELRAKVEEDFHILFGQAPYSCPPRPPASFNVAMFGVHLARLNGLLEDIRGMFETYSDIVSWKNPVVTLASMITFVHICWHFDLEYVGCVPFFVLLFWMTYLATLRFRGGLKRRLLDKEIREHRKNQTVNVDHRLHRPAGKLSVRVEAGRSIRSADLGLPGVTCCRVYWDPKRYLDGSNEKKMLALDSLSNSLHEIGTTNSQYSMNPKWNKFDASEEALRLKYLLPSSSDGDFFGYNLTPEQVTHIEFPVLQPLAVRQNGELPVLKDWAESIGAVVFEVKFQDAIALVPGSEYTLGEVVIPFAQLTQHKEISGWFRVLDEGTTRMVALGTSDSERSDDPQISICVKWTPPLSSAENPSETDREASLVIQEELLRAAIAAKERKLGFLGSSLGAINTVRGLGDHLLMVQNTLGSVLDLIGLVRCALNFSDPYKSTLLFWCVFVLLVVLSIIPTRILIIFGGMTQYFVTFMSRFGHMLQRGALRVSSKPGERPTSNEHITQESPYATWVSNAIRGLPTDEDIRRSYFWECRRLGVRKSEELALSKRTNRLERLWRAHFYSSVSILQLTDKGHSDRINAFAMIQGHRFLWWRSVGAFDNGDEPLGFLFLSGHSGMASPTPLELRSIGLDEVPRVATIFGRGLDSQVRLTMVLPSSHVRDQLEHAVSFAATVKKD